MTEDRGCQVRDLLPTTFERMDGVLREQLQRDQGSTGARLAWDFLGEQATDAIADLLHCDVFELLARGWCVVRELHKYTDPEVYPIEKLALVQLGKHKVTATVHPVLSYSIDAVKLPPLRFTVELSANFDTVTLEIRGGRIRAVGAGECYVTAQAAASQRRCCN